MENRYPYSNKAKFQNNVMEIVALRRWINVYIDAPGFLLARRRVELCDGRRINHIYSLNHPVNLIEFQELFVISACDNQSKVVFKLANVLGNLNLKSWNKWAEHKLQYQFIKPSTSIHFIKEGIYSLNYVQNICYDDLCLCTFFFK